MKYLFFILILIFSYSCQEKKIENPLNHEEFSEPILSEGHIIDLKDGKLNEPGGMIMTDSFLIIDDEEENYLAKVVDIKKNKVVKRFLKKGKGPEEAVVIDIYADNDEYFYCFGKSLKRLFRFNLDSLITYENYKPKTINLDKKTIINALVCINDSLFFGPVERKEKKYVLMDLNGIKKTMCMYPDDGMDYPYEMKSAAYQTKIAISPDRNNIVTTINVGCILEIFSVDDENHIDKLKDLHYFYPEYKVIDAGEGLGRAAQFYQGKNKAGFTDIYATNHSVFAKYSGKTLEIQPNFYELSTGKNILVYNWKGEPKYRYKLNYDIEFICLDNKGKTLFGITYTPEPKIVKFNLKR